MIYLDNAATTKPCKETIQAVAEAMEKCYGNPSSLHHLGTQSQKILGSARKTLLSKFGSEGKLIFTSGATESNNTALFGIAQTYRRRGKRIITTAIEHPSVANPLNKLEEQGFEVIRLSPKDFDTDFESAIAAQVDKNTMLVSCMAVNNETGFKIDTKRLYKLVKQKNKDTIVHIDGVQGFLKVPLEADFISISGHKIHASKGIGALYFKKDMRLSPLLFGGGQQKDLRSGTEPVELIAGLEAAIKAYKGDAKRFSELKSYLLGKLTQLEGIELNCTDNCVPNIVNFSVKGVRSEIMLHHLEEQEIYVSSGSACSKGKVSGVLDALGYGRYADNAIRVSFSAESDEGEIDILVEGIKKGIERFRR